jgi:hypothetical protein
MVNIFTTQMCLPGGGNPKRMCGKKRPFSCRKRTRATTFNVRYASLHFFFELENFSITQHAHQYDWQQQPEQSPEHDPATVWKTSHSFAPYAARTSATLLHSLGN